MLDIPTTQRRISVTKWHQLLGELRSMTIAVPGSRGLYSLLQERFREVKEGRIRLNPEIHSVLEDFRQLAAELHLRPTRIFELVRLPPTLVGAHDAAGHGAGGVFLAAPHATARTNVRPAPCVWRHRFPADITAALASWSNPKGPVTNSDLELAASIMHLEAQAQAYDIRERTVVNDTDNLATLYWQRKGSVTTTGPAAHLLRLQAYHQRYHRYLKAHRFRAGELNTMADDASHRILAAANPDAQLHFRLDLRTSQETIAAGVVPQRSAAAQRHWALWIKFCTDLHIDPYLATVEDPVILFQVFAQRYRDGRIAPRGKPVRARTVEDAVRSVGQTSAMLGAGDPRHTEGRMDFRLTRLWRGYGREDPQPNRVKPLPPQVLRHVCAIAADSANPGTQAVADMAALAFFYLLRPGEYTAGGAPRAESTPFLFRDVQLFVFGRRLSFTTSPIDDLRAATFATLTFTNQKNGVCGEVIGLGRSGSLSLCPVRSLVHRVVHLREHHANPDTPLATYYHRDTAQRVRPNDITTCLRQAVQVLGPDTLGFLPTDVSARSLRAAGAMALLIAHVDSDTIRLLGRWRSDEMLRFLHVQAEPVMRDFSRRMIAAGDYALLPNQAVPNPTAPAVPQPTATPTAVPTAAPAV